MSWVKKTEKNNFFSSINLYSIKINASKMKIKKCVELFLQIIYNRKKVVYLLKSVIIIKEEGDFICAK